MRDGVVELVVLSRLVARLLLLCESTAVININSVSIMLYLVHRKLTNNKSFDAGIHRWVQPLSRSLSARRHRTRRAPGAREKRAISLAPLALSILLYSSSRAQFRMHSY